MTPSTPYCASRSRRASRPRRARAAAALLLGLALAGCARAPASSPVGAAASVQAADPYVQTSWVLQRWSRPDGSLVDLPTGADAVSLAFSREQGQPRATGYAGCNRYSATYVAPQGRLIFSGPVSTRMGCISPARNQVEQQYLAALTRVVSSVLDDSANPRRLTLAIDNGDVLQFERRADAASGAPGNVRTIYVDAQRQPCSDGAGRAMCYRVRDSAGQPWQAWHGEIEGFAFRPGTSYRLRVVEVPVLPPPPPGAPAVRWVLDTVLEQRVEPRGR